VAARIDFGGKSSTAEDGLVPVWVERITQSDGLKAHVQQHRRITPGAATTADLRLQGYGSRSMGSSRESCESRPSIECGSGNDPDGGSRIRARAKKKLSLDTAALVLEQRASRCMVQGRDRGHRRVYDGMKS